MIYMDFILSSVILSVLLVTLFIVTYLKGHPLKSFMTKALASFSFLQLFMMIMSEKEFIFRDFHYYILGGLIFGLLGDLYLALREIKMEAHYELVQGGMILFGVGHIFYLFALTEIEYLSIWVVLGSLAAAGVVYLMSKMLKYHMPTYLWFYHIIYSVLIFMMFGQSFYVAILHGFDIKSLIFFLGALFFVISDLLLANIYFLGMKKNILYISNYMTYYLAQILIALSVLYFVF